MKVELSAEKEFEPISIVVTFEDQGDIDLWVRGLKDTNFLSYNAVESHISYLSPINSITAKIKKAFERKIV